MVKIVSLRLDEELKKLYQSYVHHTQTVSKLFLAGKADEAYKEDEKVTAIVKRIKEIQG